LASSTPATVVPTIDEALPKLKIPLVVPRSETPVSAPAATLSWVTSSARPPVPTPVTLLAHTPESVPE